MQNDPFPLLINYIGSAFRNPARLGSSSAAEAHFRFQNDQLLNLMPRSRYCGWGSIVALSSYPPASHPGLRSMKLETIYLTSLFPTHHRIILRPSFIPTSASSSRPPYIGPKTIVVKIYEPTTISLNFRSQSDGSLSRKPERFVQTPLKANGPVNGYNNHALA